MNEKMKNVLIVTFFAVLITACNLPIGRANEPTSMSDPPIQVATTETAEEAEDREVPVPANTDGAETILIPGATFWMGSEETDEEANIDEFPYHQVTVSGFYIYTHEVTNAMYASCVEADACLLPRYYESGPTTHYTDPAYAEYPVVGVDWLMAEDYCNWANGRLPTEAEWELASRGAESLAYPWGNEDATCDRVNMLGCIVPSDVVEVGSYLNGNSPYEVWDLSGNVWEWVNDWYDEDYYGLSAAINPVGPYYSELKVARGGGLYSEPTKMRSAERAGVDPRRAYDDVGFRCVPTPLLLPEEYMEPEDEHILTPPDSLEGGGDRLDDPEGVPSVPPEEAEGWAYLGHTYATCPDADGIMYIVFSVDVPEDDLAYEVTVEGNPFDCTYDAADNFMYCHGPIPENNDELAGYEIEVNMPEHGIAHLYARKSVDCPAEMMPIESADMSESCADEEGFVNLYFHYTPAITWSSVTIFWTGEEAPCVMDSPNSSTCKLPAIMDHDYFLDWTGNYEDGTEIRYTTFVHIDDDCRGTAQTIDPTCFEGHPMVQVMYQPEDRVLEEVTQDGTSLDCIGIAPGVEVCGNLVGDIGSVANISYCFEEEEECYNGAVLVPGCAPGEDSGFGFSLMPGCYEGLGPVVVINYAPADLPLVAANANGADLTCYDSPEPGYYMCSGIPGEGVSYNITFCLSDGTCRGAEIAFPVCSEEMGPAGFWNLVDVNCFHVTDIYMIIDTSMSELVPGVEFNYDVHTADGVSSYTCEMHPTIAGRIFCWGAPPLHNSPLEVCVSTPGVAEECTSFEDFWINVPLCAVPVTEEPTEEPDEPDEPTEPPLVACSTYTNSVSCTADPRCEWYRPMSQPNGYCRTR